MSTFHQIVHEQGESLEVEREYAIKWKVVRGWVVLIFGGGALRAERAAVHGSKEVEWFGCQGVKVVELVRERGGGSSVWSESSWRTKWHRSVFYLDDDFGFYSEWHRTTGRIFEQRNNVIWLWRHLSAAVWDEAAGRETVESRGIREKATVETLPGEVCIIMYLW